VQSYATKCCVGRLFRACKGIAMRLGRFMFWYTLVRLLLPIS